MPFMRETNILIDFAASETSLNLFQWFKLEDMQTAIIYAKFNELYN